MPHTCHPLHQYPFLGHPHRLLPQITVALPQTCVTYQQSNKKKRFEERSCM
ncbi:hypothetical protein Hanom_Chr01g00081411 [Helianthus anomalus]